MRSTLQTFALRAGQSIHLAEELSVAQVSEPSPLGLCNNFCSSHAGPASTSPCSMLPAQLEPGAELTKPTHLKLIQTVRNSCGNPEPQFQRRVRAVKRCLPILWAHTPGSSGSRGAPLKLLQSIFALPCQCPSLPGALFPVKTKMKHFDAVFSPTSFPALALACSLSHAACFFLSLT